jgi:nucleotide-binding universal stress UspA family protein
MIKTILAHLTGTDSDESVTELSLDIARLYAAHIACLFVRRDLANANLDFVPSGTLSEAVGDVEANTAQDRFRAHDAVEALCRGRGVVRADSPPPPDGVSASLRETSGDWSDRLVEEARFHDLLVLAGGRDRPGRLSPAALGRVVVHSGRPIVLAPEKIKPRGFKTVAIAWRNSPDAARAVTAAMPFLEKASHIDVLSASEDNGDAAERVHGSDAVVSQLRWHRLNAHEQLVVPAGREIADAILETAEAGGADLLVMGGFGHSRLRQAMFGGFTHRVLDGANLPVLMFH